MKVGECVMIGMVRWELSGSGAPGTTRGLGGGGGSGEAAPIGGSESPGTVVIPIARALRSELGQGLSFFHVRAQSCRCT